MNRTVLPIEYSTVERCLAVWSDWMHEKDTHRLSYPSRSHVFSSGGAREVDDFCAQADSHCARVMDALIGDLALHQKSAIYIQWLGLPISIRNFNEVLEEAYQILNRGIRQRGLI